MALQAGNVAPTAIVVAIAGYLCWSYWDDPVLPPPKKSTLPEIGAEMLHPKMGDAAGRDPFGTTVAFQLELDDDADDPNKGKLGHRSKPKPGEAAKTAAAAPPPARKISREEAADLLAGLTLNATYIQGERRVAMINGRAYTRGESLSSSDPKASPFLLTDIQHHKVVLDHGGDQVDLTYPNSSRRTEKRPGKLPGNKNTHTSGPRKAPTQTRPNPARPNPGQGVKS